jgi:threonine synthase
VTPLVQLDSATGCSSCSTARRWPSRTSRCSCSACCSRSSSPARDKHLTIVGATSGDTGSAAIDARGGPHGVDIFMLHPKGRVSDVQRRQMTTVLAPNVHNIAIEGSFDDAQALVKAMFNDPDFAGASGSRRSIRSTGRG